MGRKKISNLHRLRIGTRGSKLALWQANLVCDNLKKKFPELKIEIVPIKTSGDEIKQGLTPVEKKKSGIDKGIFTKEIERALLDGKIDLAVHSAKDMPAVFESSPLATQNSGTSKEKEKTTENLVIGATLPRANCEDILIAKERIDFDNLKIKKFLTSSLRRQFQLKYNFPSAKVEPLRGNVDTRLKKIYASQDGGGVLARAGLERLGWLDFVNKKIRSGDLGVDLFFEVLPCDKFFTCAGQGIIAVQCSRANVALLKILAKISCPNSFTVLRAERAVLCQLGADCTTPIGFLTQYVGGELVMRINYFRELAGKIIKDEFYHRKLLGEEENAFESFAREILRKM